MESATLGFHERITLCPPTWGVLAGRLGRDREEVGWVLFRMLYEIPLAAELTPCWQLGYLQLLCNMPTTVRTTATIRCGGFDFTINRHVNHDFIRSESAPGSPSTQRLPTSAEADPCVITNTIRQNNKIERSDAADEWYIFINRS